MEIRWGDVHWDCVDGASIHLKERYLFRQVSTSAWRAFADSKTCVLSFSRIFQSFVDPCRKIPQTKDKSTRTPSPSLLQSYRLLKQSICWTTFSARVDCWVAEGQTIVCQIFKLRALSLCFMVSWEMKSRYFSGDAPEADSLMSTLTDKLKDDAEAKVFWVGVFMLVVVDQFTASTSICSKRVQVRRIALSQDRELSKIQLRGLYREKESST